MPSFDEGLLTRDLIDRAREETDTVRENKSYRRSPDLNLQYFTQSSNYTKSLLKSATRCKSCHLVINNNFSFNRVQNLFLKRLSICLLFTLNTKNVFIFS